MMVVMVMMQGLGLSNLCCGWRPSHRWSCHNSGVVSRSTCSRREIDLWIPRNQSPSFSSSTIVMQFDKNKDEGYGMQVDRTLTCLINELVHRVLDRLGAPDERRPRGLGLDHRLWLSLVYNFGKGNPCIRNMPTTFLYINMGQEYPDEQ